MFSREALLLIFFYFFLTLTSHQTLSLTQTQEQSILLKLKQHWNSPPSIQSWTPSSSFCTNWKGITCSTNNSVTEISLSNINIIHKIPPFICDLQNLEVLDLSNNSIPGDFPLSLYNCSKLEYLDISQNYFVGLIPSDIDRLSSKLTYIDIGANNFSGGIPPAIGSLTALQTLNLYANLFDGVLAAEIGNLSNLEYFDVAYNGFKPAPIPPSFGKLKKLCYLRMTESGLIGEIPETLGDLASLEYLDLSANSLGGKIPNGLFLLKNLTVVYLYSNLLSGEIPKVVEASKLVQIDLSMNILSGSIPERFGELQDLKELALYRNELSGEIPKGIGEIPSLADLRLFQNRLTGEIPPGLGNNSLLEAVEVFENNLTGGLPENLCVKNVFVGIAAYSNNLSGKIPASLAKCDSLINILLYKNKFSGEIPVGVWSLKNLSTIMISDNMFTGGLPEKFAWNLTRLEIENNYFSGRIPSGISFSKYLAVFDGSNNNFYGEIPVGLTALSSLLALSLGGNRLSGKFPSNIISWKSLTSLRLERNLISGDIAPAIGLLPNLNNLDLSENQLSGEIPSELGRLKLSNLNLSSNQLTGNIPPAFDNLAFEDSFLNNPNLCAKTLLLKAGSCFSETRKARKLSSAFIALILVLAIVIFLVSAAFVFFAVKEFRRRKHERDISAWKLTSFQKLHFDETNILSHLTESNLIGSGGSGKVYRVSVNRSGESVAVKKIWKKGNLDRNIEKEFESEVKILGNVRHSNIVKLLCCVSNESSKLLVYEYMINSSLDKWLHAKRRGSLIISGGSVHHVVLDWPRRLQIAIGAAQGLCYMHHDCSQPIIHRDVKTSNILLDSEFNARIADFGLAKMLVKHGEPDTMSAIAGSFGYFAPEYAYTTKVNEKIDVYSFGVVLLELATGREAQDGDEQTSLAEWVWRHFQDGKAIVDAFDNEVKEPCYLEEMSLVLKLGLICTSTLPSQRPSMKEVLQILLRCSPQQIHGRKKDLGEYDVNPLLGNNGNYVSNYYGSWRKRTSEGCHDISACNV